MNINTLLNNDNFYKLDAIGNNSQSYGVRVQWGSTDIATITGPSPFVDISKSFEEDGSGTPVAIVNNITLSGKIVPLKNLSGGTEIGITNVMSRVSGLTNLFSGCIVGSLKILCNSTTLYEGSGVKVKDISFSKTEDNWVNTADYSVSLEYRQLLIDGDDGWVTDRSESWSVEPLDETIYARFNKSITQKPELYNPNLKPSAATPGGSFPSTYMGGGQATSSPLYFLNIPQFRITRRLSAKGVPKPTGTGCSSQELHKACLFQAKKWVDAKSTNTFTSGIIGPPVGVYPSKTYLYNHTRTINADAYNGTYEANDSWLAMPTGIPYTETFSIEASTDAENTKTVRVAGTIQGLILTPTGVFTPSSGIMITGDSSQNSTSGLVIDLSKSIYEISNQTTAFTVPSEGNTQSAVTNISGTKYQNAAQGWVQDIKPYLYRRACFAMRSNDRIYDPINSLQPGLVPPNPSYTRESLLNVNPVSTSEGHDPLKGTISYSYEFTNKLQVLSGVLSENIRITNTAPAALVQETQVLGRVLGPILSSAGNSNPRKSINVDIVVPKPSSIKGTLMTESVCPMYTGGFLWSGVNELINGNEPFANRTTVFFDSAASQQEGTVFKESDSEDWNPTEGRYSRSVSWIYQQCNTNRFYLDH